MRFFWVTKPAAVDNVGYRMFWEYISEPKSESQPFSTRSESDGSGTSNNSSATSFRPTRLACSEGVLSTSLQVRTSWKRRVGICSQRTRPNTRPRICCTVQSCVIHVLKKIGPRLERPVPGIKLEWVPKWWTHVRVNYNLRLLIQYVVTFSREPLGFSAIMQGCTNQRETPQCLRFIFSCSDLALLHLVDTQTSL